MLIHIIISFSRLQKKVPKYIIEQITDIDLSKSTMFQVLRGMLFNKKNRTLVKSIYEHKYKDYPDEIHSELNNQDYKNKSEIEWFENKLKGL